MRVVDQSIIKHKMGLLNLAEALHNVSQACRVMGVSRDPGHSKKGRHKETRGGIYTGDVHEGTHEMIGSKRRKLVECRKPD